jgi:hypothetical protein
MVTPGVARGSAVEGVPAVGVELSPLGERRREAALTRLLRRNAVGGVAPRVIALLPFLLAPLRLRVVEFLPVLLSALRAVALDLLAAFGAL